MVINRFVLEGATFLQASVGVLSLLAYFPQWRTLYRSKSSQNIAISSWAVWAVSSVIATTYAIVQVLANQHGWALVFSASSNLIFVLITLLMIARYRNPSPIQISS